MPDKQELIEAGVSSDPDLSKREKETNVNFPNDLDHGTFASDVPTMIKWFLSIEESEVSYYKTNDDGEVMMVRGKIPKSIVKFQGNSRKSNSHSQMVTYGPNND